jgi:hypothetical protein
VSEYWPVRLRNGQESVANAVRDGVLGVELRGWRRLSVLALAVVPFVLLGGTDGAFGANGAAPSSDPRGLALLASVQKAYVRVPGVEVAVTSLAIRTELALRSGVVMAQEVIVASPGVKWIYVARRATTTYVRAPGKLCWRRSAGVSLDQVGLPFPGAYRAVQAPRPVKGGWSLRATTKNGAGAGATVTLVINSPSHLLRSIVTKDSHGKQLVERVRNLAAAPRILTPRPRC